ncbi:MAG: cyclic nucleotide-binding domain-containing protein [Deltaproteobacteria bacterium]|nr:MAG: cyclic nucleotide-binding domain-containing protein [Deltaproteobacteria bacterium]
MAEVKELAKFDMFKPFSQSQLEEIAKITQKKTYKRNAHIYERGKRARELFVVSKGLVSLRRIEPGDKVGIAFETREPGTLFGAASFMQPQEYTLTAVCMENTEVLAIDANKLFKLCEKDPNLGYRMMLKIAQIYFERYKTAKRNLYAMVHTPAVITALPG